MRNDNGRIERLKAQYPPGTRVEVIAMQDGHAVPPNTRGTVDIVDDAGTIHTTWDNGRTLGLIPGVDSFCIIKEERQMDKNQFWQVIDEARESAGNWQGMYEPLLNALSSKEPIEILRWSQIFNEYEFLGEKVKLISAASLINNGISDDGFSYFVRWLIAQGRDVYMNALRDPDSLANLEAVKEFASESSGSEFEPMEGFWYRPQFESLSYAAYVAYESRLGRYANCLDDGEKNPLSKGEVNGIAREIQYAEDMDAYLEEGEWENSFPQLYRTFSENAVKSAECQPAVTTQKNSNYRER